MLLAVPVVAGVDWFLLGDSMTARSTQYFALSAAGIAVITLLSTNLIPAGYPRWIMAGAYGLATLNFGVGDFTPAIAVHRCKVPEVLELCRNDMPTTGPIVCVSLAQEIDGFSFYMPGQRLSSFESGQMDGAIAALNDRPSSLVFAHADILEELKARMAPSVRWAELGRHEHIVVGVTSHGETMKTAARENHRSEIDGPAVPERDPLFPVPPGSVNLSVGYDGAPYASLSEGWPVGAP
jgi:hypothetical protein